MHKPLDAGERWALFDCDDVLVDYIGGLRGAASRALKREILGLPDSWDLGKWLGVDEQAAISIISQFNETDIGFERLKPLKGAVEAVRTLRNFGFRTAIVTSSSVHPSSVERRARNVSTVFGDAIERLHIVPLGESKEGHLLKYKNAVWIEDNVKNAAIGAAMGHRAFLLPAGHNAAIHGIADPDPGVVHVKDWDELTPMILSLVPDIRAAIGVRENSLRALERASAEADHGPWTPRNADSEAMRRLVDMGVISLTKHSNRKPSAELTAVGFAVLGIDAKAELKTPDIEFEI